MAGRWLSPGTLVSSTNKTDRHNITDILLKVALSTTTPPPQAVKKARVSRVKLESGQDAQAWAVSRSMETTQTSFLCGNQCVYIV